MKPIPNWLFIAIYGMNIGMFFQQVLDSIGSPLYRVACLAMCVFQAYLIWTTAKKEALTP